jgi:hypothetical protein
VIATGRMPTLSGRAAAGTKRIITETSCSLGTGSRMLVVALRGEEGQASAVERMLP